MLMDLITLVLLILAVLGAMGSFPLILAGIKDLRYSGINISGTWQVEWVGKDRIHHKNITRVKQRGSTVKMYAENEWQDIFEGHFVGNHLLGSWASKVNGIFDNGVFIVRVKSKVPPEMEGEFVGLDNEGKGLEMMHTKMIKIMKEDVENATRRI